MPFMSPQPRSAATIYSGIVAVVTTLAVSIVLFRKLRETEKKSRDTGILKQGHANASQSPSIDQEGKDKQKFHVSTPALPLPQAVDDFAGDESQLGISVPSHAPPIIPEPQWINQDAGDEHKLDVSTSAQSTAPLPRSVDYFAGDEGQLDISIPSGPQFINSGVIDEDDLNTLPADHSSGDEGHLGISVASQVPQFIDQDVKEKNISILAQASTTLRSYGDTRSEEVPSIPSSQGSLNLQISEINATIIRNGDGQLSKVQRNLACEYIANLHIAWPETCNDLKKHVLVGTSLHGYDSYSQVFHVQPQSMAALRAEAMLNDYRNNESGPCFKGTRVALLREMADCVTGSSESRMYILSGPADTGKSTVAYTIASRAADLDLLGASFVFSRDEANHDDVKRFFITIAYQLCVHNESFANAIGGVLDTEDLSGHIREDQPHSLIQQLILDPLQSIVHSHSRPTLIVVDALDECNEKDAISVLTGLSQLVYHLPSFKVILTTRPQPYLDRFLRGQAQDGHTFIQLQDIESKDVDGDIRLYLTHNLSVKQVQKWSPSDEEIDSLICIAGNFFFIASMAVRYILDKTASNPAARVQKLRRAYAQDHIPFKNLDRFYAFILRDVVPEDCSDDDIVSRYQSVVGTIIMTVQHPLPVPALAHLTGIDVEEIRAVLDKLQSVILLGDDDVPRIYHESFSEYVTDRSRCKDLHLRIDPGARTRHTQIATHCFEIMNKHLKRNILGLGDPIRFMNNEDALKGIMDEQLQEKIPRQLRYACIYWANHLEAGNIEDGALKDGLKKFVDEHMLHWFEVLSLIGKFDSVLPAINVVVRLLRQLAFTQNIKQKEVSPKPSSNLDRLLSDVLRFIANFGEIIERSALHTYYSALPFTPTDSLLYHRYNKEAVDKICAIEGGPEKWDAFVTTGWHENEEHIQVRFSLNSALLVSSSKKNVDKHQQGKLLKVWDAATGVPISRIPGDRFAVANDCFTFASSQDNVATLYNVNGSPSGATFTASSKIQELALSSESNRVATALADGSVWLWESRCAKFIKSFDGFEIDSTGTGKIMHRPWLQFSSTGARLSYSSVNGIVKLRDGISGRAIADLECGSSNMFEFSGDGSRIASLSRDCGLTLWDSGSGGLIDTVRNVNQYPHGLAISADGSLLATADFKNVTLWTENQNHLVQIKVLNVSQSRSMAFSPDDVLAIATYDIKLYNVKTHTFISLLPFSGTPIAIAFSPDCTRLAAGGNDGNVTLWDNRGIDTSGPPSEGKGSPVAALTLSRDCSRLACGFGDGTVELWDTTRSPTKRRIASHQAHKRWAGALVFGPDGGLFASGPSDRTTKLPMWIGPNDGTIKLRNGEDGLLRGTLKTPSGLGSVALSNSMLVAAGDAGVTLWSLDTLSLIHTFTESSYETPTVSIAENNALIAVAHSRGISLLDAEKHGTITTSTFDVLDEIHTMSFLPNNQHLVALSKDGVFLSFNLINKHVTKGAMLEHLIQLPNIPLWHGVPVWYCRDKEHQYLAALFPQHKSPVPVLWIPKYVHVTAWAQGSSMIALHCEDRRIIILRLPTRHVG